MQSSPILSPSLVMQYLSMLAFLTFSIQFFPSELEHDEIEYAERRYYANIYKQYSNFYELFIFQIMNAMQV